MTTTQQHLNAQSLWQRKASEFREVANTLRLVGETAAAETVAAYAVRYERKAEDALQEVGPEFAAGFNAGYAKAKEEEWGDR